MRGGDGASLNEELAKQSWSLLHDEELLDSLTPAELERVIEILKGAVERKQRRNE